MKVKKLKRENKKIGAGQNGSKSKARSVFSCSNTEIVASSPTRGTDVPLCVFCARVILLSLRQADRPSGESSEMPKRFVISELTLNGKRPKNLLRQGGSSKLP
jgi:hypothetical protein